jgi:hypothetical protein
VKMKTTLAAIILFCSPMLHGFGPEEPWESADFNPAEFSWQILQKHRGKLMGHIAEANDYADNPAFDDKSRLEESLRREVWRKALSAVEIELIFKRFIEGRAGVDARALAPDALAALRARCAEGISSLTEYMNDPYSLLEFRVHTQAKLENAKTLLRLVDAEMSRRR